jgi:hypothetical protein
MSTVQRLSWLALAYLAEGCSDRQSPLAPTEGSSVLPASESVPVADVSGTWLWSEEVIFSVAAPLTGTFRPSRPGGCQPNHYVGGREAVTFSEGRPLRRPSFLPGLASDFIRRAGLD